MNPTDTTDPDFNHPTYYGTVVASPQWALWVKENEQRPKWDVHESMETGWLSPEHFSAFLAYCKTL